VKDVGVDEARSLEEIDLRTKEALTARFNGKITRLDSARML
jgi:hypothetical protein